MVLIIWQVLIKHLLYIPLREVFREHSTCIGCEPLISPGLIKDIPCDRDGQGVVLTLGSPSSGAKVTTPEHKKLDTGRPWKAYMHKGLA